MAPKVAALDHYVLCCEVHEDGSIEGGYLGLAFPDHAGGPDPMADPRWVADMTRAEIERLTRRVDADGYVRR